MKRVLSFFLTVCLLLSLFACVDTPAPPAAEPSEDGSTPSASPDASEEADTRKELKVMSFNMQTNAATVHERAPLAVDCIEDFDADVIGAQEINCFWLDELETLGFFDTYAMVGKARQGDAETASNEYSCIFYKKDVFTLVDSGTFWLSDRPETISKYDGSEYYRIMSYAFLERKEDGAYFLSVNTHLEWNHEEGQINLDQTETLLYLTDTLLEEDIPVIFTGDFNEPPTASGYAEMLAWGCEDARSVAKESSDACTFFDGYRGEMTDFDSEGTILDYCFVTEGDFDVLSFSVDTDCEASDHFPVLVTMKFREE